VVLVLAAAGAVLAAPAVILVLAVGYLRAVAGFSEGALIPELVSVALVFFYLIPTWTAALVEVYRTQPAPPPGTLRT
jgi:ABC-type dipeptide/oligopeptide/nickel transport system permease component